MTTSLTESYKGEIYMFQANILILDDEVAIAEMVEIILHKEGFTNIDIANSYTEATRLKNNSNYDLYILDIMLPDGSGLDLAKEIRQTSNAPIFFLTAKASDADTLKGFIHGADDYITKPFNPMELAARVKAQMKRYVNTRKQERHFIDVGRFQFDSKSATLIVDGENVPINGKQLQLLQFFCEHPNHVFSKDQLYEHVWGIDSLIDDNTIMVHIRRLREKIEVNPSRPVYLQTIRGIGYKLQTEEN